jgi:hypothetical protein
VRVRTTRDEEKKAMKEENEGHVEVVTEKEMRNK